ncbi:hypothetical protein C8P68_101385 [Mucilaginibacter yixingensis]|uniref:Uncharacterized protein n=1 Tax=Mucilaginibacter yixingensis TaxID=1295612 RepID=A0A2T5JFE6_9SPHI|nr:hypothetical protein [Mucilaginibacter yixingensis]PTR01152.1 hypothetical protein C8P68_101385 [Mucilaginibacter yixingensis]
MKKSGTLLLLIFVTTLPSFSQTQPPPPSAALLAWQDCVNDCTFKMMQDEESAFDIADAASMECWATEIGALLDLAGTESAQPAIEYAKIVDVYDACEASVTATLQAALAPFQEAEAQCILNCGTKPTS